LASVESPAFGVAAARTVVAAAYRAIEERKGEINDLNVYPVPDGDTGTNMSLTVKSIVDELVSTPEHLEAKDLASRLTTAALMGARGNSGVILSQMVRGSMEVFGRGEPVDDRLVAEALVQATETAYRAVRKPVEGTMLTVLRDLAEAAAQAAGEEHAVFAEHVVHSGWESVRRTPTLLKVLADAGVVDAGGFALVVLIEALLAPGHEHEHFHVSGGRELVRSAATSGELEPVEEILGKYTYCTSFLLQGEALIAEELESKLHPLGDSLLVVGDTDQLKVHVHTDEPGNVLSLATALGTLQNIEIDNMRTQTAARDERLRGRRAEVGQTQVVAVVVGEGNKTLFRSLGADLIVDGGQSMNPATEDILAAVRRAEAPGVIILPNNRNIILTAEQILALEEGRHVRVVRTRSLQAGLSGLVAFDSSRSADENAAEMEQALRDITTGEVTWAVRDSCVDGLEIREGSFIGLVDDKVVAAEDDLEGAVRAVVEQMLNEDKEVLTVLVGNTGAADEARRVAEDLRERHADLEVEIHEGGQPLYPLLFSAE
jgi:uncharacterized protein